MDDPVEIVIGIDGGSSKTTACAMMLDGTLVVFHDKTSAVTVDHTTNLYVIHAYKKKGDEYASAFVAETVRQSIEIVVLGVVRSLEVHAARVCGVCIGTAGIDAPGDRKKQHAAVARGMNLASILANNGMLTTLSDVEIIAGCSDAPARICVIAGTGSNCYGIYDAPEGRREVYVGGIDLPLSDWGSAARIGNDACESALMIAVGMVNDDHEFAQAVFTHLGITDALATDNWRSIKTVRGGLSKDALAGITEHVVAPLASQGNSTAMFLLHEAASDIVNMIYAAVQRLRIPHGAMVDVLLVGGVVCKNQIVSKMVNDGVLFSQRFLSTELGYSVKNVSPEVGAARIALAQYRARQKWSEQTPKNFS